MKELIDRIVKNPATSILGAAALAVYGAGETMHQNNVEPWGSIVLGIAGVMVLVGGLMAKDGDK
jgi:hypothetical protein